AVTTAVAGISTVWMGPAGAVTVFVNRTGAQTHLMLLSSDSVLANDGDRSVELAPGESTPVTSRNGRVRITLTSGDSTRTVSLRAANIAVPSSPLLADATAGPAYALGRTLAGSRASDKERDCLPDAAALQTTTRRL